MKKNKGTINVYISSYTNIIGFAKYLVKGKSMKLLQVDIVQEYQRQGIGSMIIVMLKEIARQIGCKNIFGLTVIESCKFWLKMGFKNTDRNIVKFEVE